MLRKKSRQRGPNPYSAIHFHKGYVYEPIRYTVLTASQMESERIEMVTSALKTVTTGPQAMTLPEKPGWACTAVGFDGRVYIVSYLGTEIALFFKRQLTEIVPEPGDKIPEGVLQDPKEAWQRLDLLGRSAEKSNFVLTQTQRRLEESNHLLESMLKDKDDLNDQLQRKNEINVDWIKKLDKEKLDLEKQLRAAKRQVPSSPSKPLKSKGNAGKPLLVDGKHRLAARQHRSTKTRRVK